MAIWLRSRFWFVGTLVVLAPLMHVDRIAATEVPFLVDTTIAGNFQGASSVSPADIDGDGDIDILGSASFADDIAWWENTAGDASAWTKHTIDPFFNEAWFVSSADIDGDGDIDVLGAASTAQDISWWENTAADGSAWTEHAIATNFDGARSVSSGDIDGDGDIDVLGAASNDDDISWWENTAGDGSAWTQHAVDTNYNGAWSVASADVDGDGDLDILGAASVADDVTWWENTAGDGTAWTKDTINGNFNGARSVFPADVDGDGDIDVLAAANADRDIAWWENTSGDGSTWSRTTVDANFNGAWAVAAADIDGDGDLDVLGAASNADDITWWDNTAGDGSTWDEYTIDGDFDEAYSVAAADLDGDGDLDVLGAGRTAFDVAWWLNGTIHTSATYPAKQTIDGSFDGAVAASTVDIDGDGDLDVLGAATTADDVAWWENTAGDGSAWSEHTIDSFFDAVESVTWADVDGDGDVDAVGAANIGDEVAWWENTAGDGSTWTKQSVDGSFDGARSVAVADIDEDGDLDVAGAAVVADEIAWWENTAGNGSAWSKQIIEMSFVSPISVSLSDIDDDGDFDVLGADAVADDVAWWENTAGDGSAWSKQTIDGSFDSVRSVLAVDVDGDGDLDVLGAAQNADDVAWWENTAGDGSAWTKHTIDASFDGARAVSSADLDGDGDVDVLGAAVVANDIAWWENTSGDGSSWTKHLIAGDFSQAYSVASADVDGDGDVDILAAAIDADEVAWWENRGGQFALATADTAPGGMIAPGAEEDVLSIAMSHRGRSSDHDEELVSLDLLFEETAGDPLTSMEANATIQNLMIYLDTGSGIFESGSDTLVTTVAEFMLTAGRQTVSFVDGDASVQLSHATGSKTYFVVLEFESMNMVGRVDSLRVTHITTSTSTAEDRDADIPLVLEFVADVSSSLVDTSDLPIELLEFSVD